ncbi:MAG: IS110 family transposase [Anaerovoracaceae bacterium]
MERYCGLDIHKDSVFMCIIDEFGFKKEHKFSTLTCDLLLLREVLLDSGVRSVAMESTSIYWIFIWRLLVDYFDIKLVNPLFIKQLPGRKTDIRDAHWIAIVLMKGLVCGSYVPSQAIQTLRQYERCYSRLNKKIVSCQQFIDMQLQRCNIRFSNYISDIGSQGMRKVLKSIIAGKTTSEELLACAHTRTKNKHGIATIQESLNGVFEQVDIDMLKLLVEELEMYERQQEECLMNMVCICNESYADPISLLVTIPGIKQQSAMTILAELGNDLSAFKTSSSLVGWAGLRPRNEESAGKIKSRKTMHGNKFLRVILVQCAWASSRTKNSRLGIKYQELKKRMSPQKALVAIARKLLVIIWNVLTKKETYKASGVKND